MIIGTTDVIQQGVLTISRSDVKIKINVRMILKILWLMLLMEDNATVNSKFNSYSSTSQNSNSRILIQNKILPFNQLDYSSTEIKELRIENESLVTQVKEAERKHKLSEI